MASGALDLMMRIKADSAQARSEFRETEGALSRLGGAGKVAAAAAATAFVGMTVKGVAAFRDFDTGMREVFTLMPGISQEAMGGMADDVRAMSQEFGIATDEVVPALYQAISAGVPPDNVMTFMATAAETSIGGVTDLETAVDALSTVTNAYGSEVYSAQEASDILFTTVKLGKTDMTQLGSSLFQVVPIASQLGIGLDEVGASVATLTGMGTPTRVAMTQIRGALAELSKEGSVAFDNFQRASGQTFPEFVRQGGTVGDAMLLLADYAEETGTETTNLFGSIEGGMAASSLSSETGAAKMAAAMEEMQASAGATGGAFDTMAGGIGFSMDRLAAMWDDTVLSVGESLAPAFEALMPALMDIIPALGDALLPIFDALAPVIEALVPVVAALAPALEGVAVAVEAMVPLIEAAVPVIKVLADVVGILGDSIAYLVESPLDQMAQDAMPQIIDAFRDGTASADEVADAFVQLSDKADISADDMRIAAEAAGFTADEMILLDEALRASGDGFRAADSPAQDLIQSEIDAALAAGDLQGATADLTGAIDEQTGAVDTLASAEKELTDARRAALDPAFAVLDAYDDLAAAQATLTRLQGEGKEGTEEWDDALMDALTTQADFNSALADIHGSMGDSEAAIRALAAQLGLGDDATDELIASIRELNALKLEDKTFNISQTGVSIGGALGSVGFRAAGGPVSSGGLYVVGEEGPELFVPDTAGQIVPGEPRTRGGTPAAVGSGGGGMTVNLYSYGTVVSERELIDLVKEGLAASVYRGDELVTAL